MPDILYRGHSIRPSSYEDKERWVPLALVTTKTSFGMRTRTITSEERFILKTAANAEAIRLAKAWVEGQEEALGDPRRGYE